MKKTVAQLDQELQTLKYEAGNIQLSQHTVWHWEQVAKILEEHDRYGELVKMEVTRDFAIGHDKRCYHVMAWHRPLLNIEARAQQNGDYYQSLRDTKEHI